MGSSIHGLFVYVIGLGILFLELFIPSGGILGLVGTLCTIYGIWVIIHWNLFAGLVVIVATTAYIYGLVKFWAKKVTLSSDLSGCSGSSQEAAPPDIIGQEGETLTKLGPSGFARINDRRLQVVSDCGFLEKGVKIRVLDVSGNRIVVTKTEI